MNIYQLKTQYQHDAARLADMELDDQTLHDTLEAMAGDLEDKAVATVIVARNMRPEAAAIREAAAAMIGRAKALETRADALEQRVFHAMLDTGITKISCPYFALSIANNPPAVDVFDSLQVPQDYLREIPASSAPDKALIKRALQDGFDVPGARLVHGQRLAVK